MPAFLRIRDWSKHQHYKDRSPPWIKLYSNTITQPWWVMLENESRVLGIAAMVLAAATGNKIPVDPEYTQRAAYLRERPNWKPLVLAGFVEVVDEDDRVLAPDAITLALASNMLAPASALLARATGALADAPVSVLRGEERDQSRADQSALAGASAGAPKEGDLLGDAMNGSPSSQKTARRSKLPKPYPMSAEHERVGKGILPNDADVESEFREWCTYWWGTGEAKADWLATWENRCLSQAKSGRYARKPPEANDGQQPPQGSRLDWHLTSSRKGST